MQIAPRRNRCTATCPYAFGAGYRFHRDRFSGHRRRTAGRTPGAYPLHQPDRAARCVPRRVQPSRPLAIPFDQPSTWKKHASTVQLLPAARHRAHARCLPAIFAFPAITAQDLPLQSPSSLIGSAVSQVGPQRSYAPRSRLRRLLWLPCRPMTRFACPCASVYRLARTLAKCPVILFARFFSGRARRSSSVQGCVRLHRDHIPPPPSPFNLPRRVGLHATVPASYAERVCPCVSESSRAVSKCQHCQPYTTPHRAKLGETARKPNGYRVSTVLSVDHGAVDLIQKKAASDCGR